jgi:hypothetical protein
MDLDVEKELTALTGVTHKPEEPVGRYLVRLARATTRLKDEQWHTMSGFSQRWANSVLEAVEAGKKEVPGFNGTSYSTKPQPKAPPPYVKSKPGDREIIYRLILEHPDANKMQLHELTKALGLDHDIPLLTISAARKGFISSVNFLNDHRLLNFRWRNRR